MPGRRLALSGLRTRAAAIGDLLVRLSGADSSLLRDASPDRARYTGIGGAVLTTSTLAAVSMFFALRMAVDAPGWSSVALALLWFLAILNLDRLLVVSLQRTESRLHTVLVALPRVLLALLFGAIISTPLMLQAFDGEVRVAVREIQGAESRTFQRELIAGPDGRRIKELERQETGLLAKFNGNGLAEPENDPEIKRLRESLPPLEQKVTDNGDRATCELTGDRCKGKTSGKSGNGPRYRKYVERKETAQKEVDDVHQKIKDRTAALQKAAAENKPELRRQAQAALPGVQGELHRLRDMQKGQREAFERANGDNAGLLIRLKGLDRAAAGEAQLQWARFLLFLFVMVLECLPILVKVLQLIGPSSPYDHALIDKLAMKGRLRRAESRVREGIALRDLRMWSERNRRTEQRRAQMLDDHAVREIEAEDRVRRRRVEQWERDQMKRAGRPEHGQWRDPPQEGLDWRRAPLDDPEWSDPPQSGRAWLGPGGPAPSDGQPIPARILRGGGGGPPGGINGQPRVIHDDLTLYPPARRPRWFRRWLGRRGR